MPSQFSLPLDPAVVQSVGQQSGLTVSTVGTLGTPLILTDPAYKQANTGTVLAQAAFNYANTLTLGAAVDAFARSNTYYLSGVDATQNTNISIVTALAQAAFDSANNVAPKIQPAFNQANTGTVLAQASFDYANSRQNIQTSASPTFNGLTLTNALAIAQGGTGATSASSALTNLLPTGTTSGYVLTTGGPGTYYWAAGGGGGGGATPGTTINSSRLSYTANGSGFSYTTPTYIPGASQLRVYFDGLRQFASEYTETNSTTCTFSTAPASGVVVLFEVDGYINNPYYANNITYTINSTISSTANTIQLAIDGLASISALKSGTTFTSPAMAPTASVGVANTQIATTAFVNTLANSGITFSHNITGLAGSSTISNSLNTGNNYQINSLGVGTAASGTAGEIRAINEVTAYYSSDEILKENIQTIDDALGKLKQLRGVMFDWTDAYLQARGGEDGYFVRKHDTGVIAQDVERVLPEVVAERQDGTLAVKYEKLAGLIIQSIIELSEQVEELKDKIK
jgi:hypothetical protein